MHIKLVEYIRLIGLLHGHLRYFSIISNTQFGVRWVKHLETRQSQNQFEASKLPELHKYR